MQTISIGYGQVRIRKWLDQLGLMPGERKMFECLILAARGKDHAWPSQEWLAEKVNVTVRSIRNYIRRMEEREIIRTMRVRINGCLRLVYYFLAHPVIVAAVGADRKNFPVGTEEFSGHLIKRKEDKEIPPTPQGGSAAGAAKESAHEQQSETQGTAPIQQGESAVYRRPVESPRLRIAAGTATGSHADGLRGESKILQQTAPTERAEKTDAAKGDGLTPAPWQAALALLLQQIPERDFNLWIRPNNSMETEKGLQLDCPDRYAMAWVQEHFNNAISDALKHAGITDFFFTFGEQAKELQEKKNKELRAEAARNAECQAKVLQSLPMKEQFAVLVSTYPRKTSGNWFAWRAFRRLHRRGELPDIQQLLQLVQEEKSSEDWQRDAGRWIPGLHKWLRNKPWWSCGKER